MQCAQKSNKSLTRQESGALPLREWSCSPFFSTGLGSLCEFVSSQPQRRGHWKQGVSTRMGKTI